MIGDSMGKNGYKSEVVLEREKNGVRSGRKLWKLGSKSNLILELARQTAKGKQRRVFQTFSATLFDL